MLNVHPECALACSPRGLCLVFSVLECSHQPYCLLTLIHLWISAEYFLIQKPSLSLLPHPILHQSPVFSLSLRAPAMHLFLAHSLPSFGSSHSGFSFVFVFLSRPLLTPSTPHTLLMHLVNHLTSPEGKLRQGGDLGLIPPVSQGLEQYPVPVGAH